MLATRVLDAAMVEAERSSFEDPFFSPMVLKLGTDEVVPMRVRYLENPYRIVFEFEDMDFTDLPEGFGEDIRDVNWVNFGAFGSGSRFVIGFEQPYRVDTLEFSSKSVNGHAGLRSEFAKADPEEFGELTQKLGADPLLYISDKALPENVDEALPMIVIDPGHGGVDPGAVRFGVQEKEVTLQASKVIKEALEKTGRYEVVLTREGDEFSTLLARRRFAERLGADLFLSIHADSVEVGDVRGTTIYKLSDRATSQIAAHFSHFENRVDLFAGEDMAQDENDLSLVLTDLAHKSTRERADYLARILQQNWQEINARPEESRVESAAFAVLKAPEIPSLLLEIGYLSNSEDVHKIVNPVWLEEMAEGIVSALDRYYSE